MICVDLKILVTMRCLIRLVLYFELTRFFLRNHDGRCRLFPTLSVLFHALVV
jgi:hypothetical protein